MIARPDVLAVAQGGVEHLAGSILTAPGNGVVSWGPGVGVLVLAQEPVHPLPMEILEDIDFILHPDKQIRFNRRQNRLYIDTDYSSMKTDDYLIIECYRTLDPEWMSTVCEV